MTQVFASTGGDLPLAAPDRKLPRIAALDTWRGIALLAMATYHFSWDLEFFGYLEPGTTGAGAFKIYARLIAGTFLFLAGISLVLGHTPMFRARSFGIRFAKIAGAAAVISIVTWFAVPDGFIFFGILHSIAAASLIGCLFLRAPAILTLLVAAAIFMAPSYLRMPLFDTPALWWVGLSTIPIRSNDFVPLFPWLAPFLAGMAATQAAVRYGWLSALASGDKPQSRWMRFFGTAGRHSLAIYLIHQPLLIGCVYLFSLVMPAAVPDPVEAYRNSCVAACGPQQTAGFCATFCDCTLDRLMEQSLFEPLNNGEIDVNTDPRIARMSAECSADVPQEGSK
ncbi:heparan-alpha-glucosaminide N-acetyltransferase [Pararhizobium sp.]|uniref:heparan-alpha-glucosaminide N-acetyltransferase n=1 Tax=Pararhizobium sp. TaxID=1977563 RepID=UPI002724F3B3|nr:DUF1624 domain-containing protein [Pararhizobium sp.]MDO9415330.1 DUF1624 domain-containing protein [Pararhizobium sp.]